MNFLPVAHWELRQASRRLLTYYSRAFSAMTGALICLAMLYAGFGGFFSATVAGRNLFLALSSLGFVYALIQGVLLTADCLSEEKREGTIGLLFLTDLKAFDIVMGKLIGQSSNALYCLCAAFPALALSFFLGGVTTRDYLQMALALMNALFFSLAIGLLVSATSRNQAWVMSASLTMALVFAVALPALGYLKKDANVAAISLVFLTPTPTGAFLAALSPAIALAPPGAFLPSLITSHLLAWGFLLLAMIILPHAWQDKTQTASRGILARVLGRFKRVRNADDESGTRPGMRFADVTVLRFAEQQHRLRASFWSLFGVVSLVWAWGLALYPKSWLNVWPVCALITAIMFHYALKFEIAAQACRVFSEDRRSGVLELLLTTPLGEDEIIRIRLLALKRKFLGPTFLVFLIDLAFLCAMTLKQGGLWAIVFSVAALLPVMAIQLADMYVLTWLGLWLGLAFGSFNRALRYTIFYVILLPWILFLAVMAVIGVLTHGRIFNNFPWPALWLVVVFACNLGLGGWAISRLRDDLRATTSQSLTPRKMSAWRSFLRRR